MWTHLALWNCAKLLSPPYRANTFRYWNMATANQVRRRGTVYRPLLFSCATDLLTFIPFHLVGRHYDGLPRQYDHSSVCCRFRSPLIGVTRMRTTIIARERNLSPDMLPFCLDTWMPMMRDMEMSCVRVPSAALGAQSTF